MSIYAVLTDSELADEAEKHGVAMFGDGKDVVIWYADDTPESLVAEIMRRRRGA